MRALAGLVTALALVGSVTLVAGCGAGGTTEVSTEIGWGTLDDVPRLPLDGVTAAGPQIIPEVTLADGGVPTVPQPSVPAAPTPTVLSATTPPTATVAEPARPPVLATPAAGAAGPPPSLQVPESVPGGARAVERLDSDAQRSVAAAALGRIRFDWRTSLNGWQVRFLPGRRGLRGSTFPDSRVIEVYVRNGDRVDGLSHVIAHEMGHAVDVSRFGPVQRDAWKAGRGIPGDVAWFPSADGARDYATGAGDFAESFAFWQTGVGWYSELGPPPDAAQTALLVALSGLS